MYDTEEWIEEDPVTGCWLWKRAKSKNGYGQFKRRGKVHYAHQYHYERVYGPVPAGMELDHVVCQRRPCCNPSHLEPVPHIVNLRRRRGVHLNADKVRVIRQLLAAGHRQKDIADRFGVRPSVIWDIKHGYTWRDVGIDRHAKGVKP